MGEGALTMPHGALMQSKVTGRSSSQTSLSAAGMRKSASHHNSHLPELEVFGIQDGDVLRMFAWVNCEDIDVLCSHANETALQKCLGELEFTEAPRAVSTRASNLSKVSTRASVATNADPEQFPI